MTIVHCPRCRDEVTVPAKAPPQALVRCPLCLEEYLLSEALSELPPLLVVIGGEVEEELALVGAAAAAAEYGLAGGGIYGSALDSSAPGGAAVHPARPTVKAPPRPKRKPKSAVVELIKIVGGGVIGLGLGVLFLWWVLGRDIGLGPTVAPYAPWIVPAKFHGDTPAKPTTVQNDTSGGAASGNTNPAPGGAHAALPPPNTPANLASGAGINDPAMPAEGAIAAAAPAEPEAFSGLESPAVPIDFPAIGPERTKPAEGGSSEAVKPASAQPDLTDLLPAGNAPPSSPAESPQPAAAPAGSPSVATAADLVAAVAAASEANLEVDRAKERNEPTAVRQQLFTDLYLAVAEAGRVTSHLDAAAADVAEPLTGLKEMLAGLAAQPGKFAAFKHLGRIHLPQRQPAEGFAFSGKVIEYQAAGSVFECTIDAEKDVQVQLVSLGNPQDFCEIGDEVLVTGRLVADPQQQLPGYEGEAPLVVLLGELAVVPTGP